MAKQEREADPEMDELRDRLHAMETKLSRMRASRNNHNASARGYAEQRDAIQSQYSEVREAISEKLEEQKNIREQAKIHQARRDALQEQLRGLFSKSKSGRVDEKKGKSVILQLSEKQAEVENIERRLEVDGTLSIAKENNLHKQLKILRIEVEGLLPLVDSAVRVKIDLDDLEGSIEELKAEADTEHQSMVALHEKADEVWNEVKPKFEERDFLKSEGDRLHDQFVSSKEEADKVHQQIDEMMKLVTTIRGDMKALDEERQSWIEEHNRNVEESTKKPEDDAKLAGSLVSNLLDSGNLSLGGLPEAGQDKPAKKSGRKKKAPRVTAARKKRGKSK